MVKGGAWLTICITVPLTILECFLKDEFTMSASIGNVASDLTKIGITSIMAAIGGLIAGGMTSIASVPILATIVIGLAIGWGLEGLDKKFKLTDKLVASLEKFAEQLAELEDNMGRKLQEGERSLVWRITGGFDINDPLGSLRKFR